MGYGSLPTAYCVLLTAHCNPYPLLPAPPAAVCFPTTNSGGGVRVTVYLSGEIHSDWREQIVAGIDEAELPVDVLAPVTDHPASDDVGVSILGDEDRPFRLTQVMLRRWGNR